MNKIFIAVVVAAATSLAFAASSSNPLVASKDVSLKGEHHAKLTTQPRTELSDVEHTGRPKQHHHAKKAKPHHKPS